MAFWSNVRFLATGIWASTGSTASHPYTKEYGVCPVDALGVVRFAQRTDGNSSTHLPFAPFNLFRIELIMTLLLDSANPLDCGYLGVEVTSLIPRCSQNVRVLSLINCDPLSHIISDGTPNLWIMLFWMKDMTSLS